MLKLFTPISFKHCSKYCFSSSGAPIDINYVKLEKQDKTQPQNNLLVLHGVMGNINNFHGLMSKNKDLRQNLDIYLLDARNHGQSPWTEEMTFPLMADDVEHFLSKHKLNNLFLMGHSMGAKTLMTLLCKHPQLYSKIKGAIIVDMLPVNFMYGKYSHQFDKEKQFFQSLSNLKLNEYKNLLSIQKEILKICEGDRNQANYLGTNLKVQQKDQKPFYSWQMNVQSLYANLQTLWKFVPSYSLFQNNIMYRKPFQIILGSKSHLTSAKDASKSYSLVFDKKEINNHLITIQDGTHQVPFEKPIEFFRILNKFIKENI